MTNPWFPLRVGRTLVYTGVKDGKSALNIMTTTRRTRGSPGCSPGCVPRSSCFCSPLRPVQTGALSVEKCLQPAARLDSPLTDPDPDPPRELNADDRQVQGSLVLDRVRPVTGSDQSGLHRLVQRPPPRPQCSVHARMLANRRG